MSTATFYAWAVACNSTKNEGFIGPFWFTSGDLYSYHDGVRIALFRTRKQARDVWKRVDGKTSFKKSKVVRVRAEIKSID